MDVNMRGCFTEYKFAVECLRRGYGVCMPLLHTSIFDMIIDTGSRLLKIQVKSTKKTPSKDSYNTIQVPIQRRKFDGVHDKKYYDIDSVDYFAVFSYFFDGFFIFPNTGKMTGVRISLKGKYKKFFNNFNFDNFP